MNDEIKDPVHPEWPHRLTRCGMEGVNIEYATNENPDELPIDLCRRPETPIVLTSLDRDMDRAFFIHITRKEAMAIAKSLLIAFANTDLRGDP